MRSSWGAIVSSTDAAAVFSVLQAAMPRSKRLSATLEMESGLNDPLAVALTMVLTESILGGRALGASVLVNALVWLLVGLVAGAGIGFAGRWLLLRLRLPAGGLYPVVALALAFVAFGVPTLIHGSGFLAVYVTGIVLGNRPIPYHPGVQRVSEAVAWLSQILMFLTFGLLVFPSRLLAVAGVGVAIALLSRDRGAAVGRDALPGSVSIPAPQADLRRLGGASRRRTDRPFHLSRPARRVGCGTDFQHRVLRGRSEHASAGQDPALGGTTSRARGDGASGFSCGARDRVAASAGERLLSFSITPDLVVSGLALSEIPFPAGAAAILLIRGAEMLAAEGVQVLQGGDHLYVICRAEDRGFIQLLFGETESA